MSMRFGLKNLLSRNHNELSNITPNDHHSELHNHAESDITNLLTDLSGKALLSHNHAESDITNLITHLDDKSPVDHLHIESDTVALVTDLAGKAPIAHTHTESNITNLVTDLAAKEPANANIQIHVTSAHAPADAQKNSDITKAEIEAKLTGVISSHSHAGGGVNTLKKTANQTINSGAAVFVDITDLTFPVVNGVNYAFEFYIVFRSANVNTGWKAGVNCPTGTLDFWADSDIIANGAAGVTTHTKRHNVVRDDMTLLTATITAAVDLAITIKGRYLCTQDGTFAARFANELANTDIVVQSGSWGMWF